MFTTITNQKGGNAKTTTAVSLAHALARAEIDTLLIDSNPQGNASTCLGTPPGPQFADMIGCFIDGESAKPQHTILTQRPYLTIIPSNQRTKRTVAELQMALAMNDTALPDILNSFQQLASTYQHVIIDTSTEGIFHDIALKLANNVIIPTALDDLSIEAVANTIATIERLGTNPRYMIVPTFYRPQILMVKNLDALRETWPGHITDPVPDSAAIRQACAESKTIWELTSNSTTLDAARQTYQRLANWIKGDSLIWHA